MEGHSLRILSVLIPTRCPRLGIPSYPSFLRLQILCWIQDVPKGNPFGIRTLHETANGSVLTGCAGATYSCRNDVCICIISFLAGRPPSHNGLTSCHSMYVQSALEILRIRRWRRRQEEDEGTTISHKTRPRRNALAIEQRSQRAEESSVMRNSLYCNIVRATYHLSSL